MKILSRKKKLYRKKISSTRRRIPYRKGGSQSGFTFDEELLEHVINGAPKEPANNGAPEEHANNGVSEQNQDRLLYESGFDPSLLENLIPVESLNFDQSAIQKLLESLRPPQPHPLFQPGIPSGLEIVTFERQTLFVTLIITLSNGMTFMLKHELTSDLEESITLFLRALDLPENRNFRDFMNASDFNSVCRQLARIGAMFPKVSADLAGSYQIMYYIHKYSRVIKKLPHGNQSDGTGIEAVIACLVHHEEPNDNETGLVVNPITCVRLGNTHFYSTNTFLLVKSEIMDIMFHFASLHLFKHEFKFLERQLENLFEETTGGFLEVKNTLAIKQLIEESFKLVGVFSFEYLAGGKLIMKFKKRGETRTDGSGNTLEIKLEMDRGPSQRVEFYSEILSSLLTPEVFQTQEVHGYIEGRFTTYQPFDCRFLSMSALLNEMFGMDLAFFEDLHTRALAALASDNHDGAPNREPRVQQIDKATRRPIYNVSVMRLFGREKFPQVLWGPIEDARNLLDPAIPGSKCVSIANGILPGHLSRDQQGIRSLQECPGVFLTQTGTARCEFPNCLLYPTYDSQKAKLTLSSETVYYYVPPTSRLNFTLNRTVDRSNIKCTLTYLGDGGILRTTNNKPFKTHGIVYISPTGELIIIEGNVTDKKNEDSYFKQMFKLVEKYKDPENYKFPVLVKAFLDDVFKVRGPVYNKNGEIVVDGVTDYDLTTLAGVISAVEIYIYENQGGNRSLATLMDILDVKYGNKHSATRYFEDIQELKFSNLSCSPTLVRASSHTRRTENDQPPPPRHSFFEQSLLSSGNYQRDALVRAELARDAQLAGDGGLGGLSGYGPPAGDGGLGGPASASRFSQPDQLCSQGHCFNWDGREEDSAQPLFDPQQSFFDPPVSVQSVSAKRKRPKINSLEINGNKLTDKELTYLRSLGENRIQTIIDRIPLKTNPDKNNEIRMSLNLIIDELNKRT